ncbi:hypothetical protein QQA20_25220 [Vibrio parahaemolyticus]|uniref:hypothetical protein n=1 Tax=Vibrio parahaemolyticus TaxID=670 RepID=UPI0004DF6973|nr:hypothetical protein [Vibrio parahaemolyticus]MBY4654329.1 hypothetical protein [Vibrio parahaemolyticus]MCR9855840.1 hypothetical protein [Vibrio parahaemolyticus]MDK9506354.1 hypothetical protein [Vibrio parahaemolyticus]MRE11697.1 hypothetical protein [Vibrio parahaemolyticus]NKJ89602.1 hypothetical protein [Vibrio parahaemolyticus]
MGNNVTQLSAYRKNTGNSEKKQNSTDKYGLADALIQQLMDEADAPLVSASIHRPTFGNNNKLSFSIRSIVKVSTKQKFFVLTMVFSPDYTQQRIALAND